MYWWKHRSPVVNKKSHFFKHLPYTEGCVCRDPAISVTLPGWSCSPLQVGCGGAGCSVSGTSRSTLPELGKPPAARLTNPRSPLLFKERHEAVVRRTMERSQKPKQKHNRWSWGGPLHGSPRAHSAGKQAGPAFRPALPPCTAEVPFL